MMRRRGARCQSAVEALASSLNSSPLQTCLLRWCTDMGIGGFSPFRRSGFNRARHARLAWLAAVRDESLHPVEAIAAASLPDSYGVATSALQFTLDVIICANPYLTAISPPGTALSTAEPYRLPVDRLYATLDALMAALTDRTVTTALAGMAGIDPVIMPMPPSLDFVTGPIVRDLLQPAGLTPIPGAGQSHGANLLANPTLDLADPRERELQLDDWLQQIALDAGLSGMESVLSNYHQRHATD